MRGCIGDLYSSDAFRIFAIAEILMYEVEGEGQKMGM